MTSSVDHLDHFASSGMTAANADLILQRHFERDLDRIGRKVGSR